ncbi:MAG: hypothetical protein ACLP7Q_09030 [Isosphaeraceae bacterium]
MLSFRERDIRNLIGDLLDQTGAFDGVYLSGLPEERGETCGDSRAVVIEPDMTTRADPTDDFDGDPLLSCQLKLIFMARDEDPQVRDEVAELLLNVAAVALDGNTLSGMVLPSRTKIRSWSWQKPVAPERRITAILEFQYLGDGWAGFNTSD